MSEEIGRRRRYPLATFEIPEVETLLQSYREIAFQIDFIFVSDGLSAVRAEMVKDEEQNGIFPSDHFARISDLRLAAHRTADSPTRVLPGTSDNALHD